MRRSSAPHFPLDLLGEILARRDSRRGPSRSAGRTWVSSSFLRRGTTLAFRHDLVRATAYEGLSFRRRRDIHGRVGMALEERLGSRADEEAALLSLHFHEAGEYEQSWRYSVLAGDRAAAGFANVVASEQYRRALDAAEQLPRASPPTRSPSSRRHSADMYERFGGYEPGLEAYLRALELVDDPIAEGRLWRKAGSSYERLGRYDDAVAALATGVGCVIAAPAGDEAVSVRAALEYALAGVAYRQTRYEDAIAHADRAIELAESTGDDGAVARASYIAGGAYDDLGREGGRPYLERAIAIYGRLGDDRGLSAALNNLGIHHYTRGRWDESVALYRRSREADERAGDPLNAAVHANNEAEVLSDQGHLDEAEPLFREMVRICGAASFPIGVALGTSNLGRVAARAGRSEEAHALYADAAAQFEAIEARRYVTETRARIAECLVLEGRHAEAIAMATELARGSPGLALRGPRGPDPPPARLRALAGAATGGGPVASSRRASVWHAS